jgi:hypothetical protein
MDTKLVCQTVVVAVSDLSKKFRSEVKTSSKSCCEPSRRHHLIPLLLLASLVAPLKGTCMVTNACTNVIIRII